MLPIPLVILEIVLRGGVGAFGGVGGVGCVDGAGGPWWGGVVLTGGCWLVRVGFDA